MGRFLGKVVIVTGGSSGIGESTAIAFAKEGASLAITGRNKERLSNVAEKCRSFGAKVLELACNMELFDTLEPIISKTAEEFGRIDILVNNAGVMHVGHVEKVELEDYVRLTNVNIRAPMFLCKFALPHLRKTKGCIVNVSSINGFACYPGSVLYSISKAALDHFTRGFASECAEDGVRVNCVNPGVVHTRIFDEILSEEEIKKARSPFESQQPLGVLQGEHIANGILYLSDAHGVTGTTLVVDGGLLLPCTAYKQ